MAGVPFKPIAARIMGLDEFSVKKGRVYDTAISKPGRQADNWGGEWPPAEGSGGFLR